MNAEKVIRIFRIGFAFLFGAALMIYAGYSWHMDWIADWQALIAGIIGFVFLYMPDKLSKVVSQGLSKIFHLTIGRFFGTPVEPKKD